jgi:hypothetical protein
MNKLTNAISAVVRQVFTDFSERGGIVENGEEMLTPDQIASEQGLLPLLIYLAKTYVADDLDLTFASVMDFVADPASYTGYRLARLETEGSASPTLLSMSTYLREVVVPEAVVGLDVSDSIAEFRAYCEANPFEQLEPPGEQDQAPDLD